jgi:hypothetical protein
MNARITHIVRVVVERAIYIPTKHGAATYTCAPINGRDVARFASDDPREDCARALSLAADIEEGYTT